MARLYNTGKGIGEGSGVPTIRRRDPQSGEHKEYVRVPSVWSGCQCAYSAAVAVKEWDGICRCGREQLVQHEPGNVYLSLTGYSFYTIPRGKFIDLPAGVTAKSVQGMCPHLVPEEDYLFEAKSAPKETDKANQKVRS